MKFRKILPAVFAVVLLSTSPARADFIAVTLDGSDAVLATVASIEMVFTGLDAALAASPDGSLFSDPNGEDVGIVGIAVGQTELPPGAVSLFPGGGAFSGGVPPVTASPVEDVIGGVTAHWHALGTSGHASGSLDSLTYSFPAGSLASTVLGKTVVDVWQANGLAGETVGLSGSWSVILRDAASGIIGSSTVASSEDIGVILTTLDVTVVPVPAAVWLFGSALGLLGWVRRRSVAA